MFYVEWRKVSLSGWREKAWNMGANIRAFTYFVPENPSGICANNQRLCRWRGWAVEEYLIVDFLMSMQCTLLAVAKSMLLWFLNSFFRGKPSPTYSCSITLFNCVVRPTLPICVIDILACDLFVWLYTHATVYISFGAETGKHVILSIKICFYPNKQIFSSANPYQQLLLYGFGIIRWYTRSSPA